MKGQAQAVTAVLITSVVVGSIATSYIWGVPLLEKQQSQAQLQQAENNMIGLYNQIVQVSESGEGTTAEFDIADSLSNSESLSISINEKQDYIDIRFRNRNSRYPRDTWTLIKGKRKQNLTIGSGDYANAGSDLPGAVAVRSVGAPDGSLITYRVEFRNMLSTSPSGRQLSRINLSVQGQSTATQDSTLYISNEGTSWERGNQRVQLSNGERLPRKNTNIQITIR